MTLFFYYTTSFSVYLPKDAVEALLRKNTVPKNHKPVLTVAATNTAVPPLYSITCTPAGFRLIREDETAPFCFGKILPYGGRSQVHLKFRNPWFLVVFMNIWASGALFGTSMVVLATIEKADYAHLPLCLLVISPFYLAMWFFQYIGFKKDVNKTLAFLKGIGFTQVRV